MNVVSSWHLKISAGMICYNESNLQNFTETDIYYPIPYDEWLLNPEGMYQNEGY